MAEEIPDWLRHKCDLCSKPTAVPNFPLTEEEMQNFFYSGDHGYPVDDYQVYDSTEPLLEHQSAYLEQHPYVIEETELKCGHRFHRQCLQSHYGGPGEENLEMRRFCPLGVDQCPVMELDHNGRLIVYHLNEGGVTRRLDLTSEFDNDRFVGDRIKFRNEVNILYATERGDFDTVRYLLDEEDISPNESYPQNEYSTLHLAAFHNYVEIAQLLLEFGVESYHSYGYTEHHGTCFNMTPYDIAWSSGFTKMCEVLAPYEKGRPPRPVRRNNYYGPYNWNEEPYSDSSDKESNDDSDNVMKYQNQMAMKRG